MRNCWTDLWALWCEGQINRIFWIHKLFQIFTNWPCGLQLMRMWLREGEKVEAEVDLIKSELKSETSECGTSTRWGGGGWECEHGGVEVEDQDGGEGGACFQAGEKQDMKLEGSASALEEVIIIIITIIIIIIIIITITLPFWDHLASWAWKRAQAWSRWYSKHS